jgi:heme oxygenase
MAAAYVEYPLVGLLALNSGAGPVAKGKLMQAPIGPLRGPVAAGALRGRLREETSAAHMELEAAIDILGRVADGSRVLQILERFLGFHLIWEHGIRQRPALRSFFAPRSRLPHLRRDLAALGLTNSEQSALPSCAQAAALVDDPSEAVGSIYVLEGSTLGGQVIGRALANTDWVPPGGLAYFDPYPGRTGEMWRAFGAWAETSTTHEEHSAAVAGANRTFAVLQSWLTA